LNRQQLESGQTSAHRPAVLDEALSVGEAGGGVTRIWKVKYYEYYVLKVANFVCLGF
jgi:hypothetical protein